jgi:hypothetical protein
MTLIEIRPHRWGWSVFEAPGVEPVFPEKHNCSTNAAWLITSMISRDAGSTGTRRLDESRRHTTKWTRRA